jgi:hypothetical protein
MPQFNNSSARIAVDRTDAIEIDHALILALRPEAALRIAADKLIAAVLDK